MWADDHKTQVDQLLVQYEIVKYEIQKDVKGCIESACGSITERFPGDILLERFVEPINDCKD